MSLYPITRASANFYAARLDFFGQLASQFTGRTPARRGVAVRPSRIQEPGDEPALREVIVPLDGSPYAEHALPWAIQIASLAGVQVRLVHVHTQMQPAFHGRRLELYREFDRLLREPMEQYMADVARRIARASDVSISPMVVDGRRVTSALSDIAAATSDLVVMATRGRTAMGRMLVGSALDAILGATRAPLLHVRGYACPVDLTARPSLRHALVPIDGSASSQRILGPVASLSKAIGGQATLMHVVPAASLFSEGCDTSSHHGETSALEDYPLARLDEIAQSWRAKLPDVRTSVVWSDSTAAREILSQADEREADYIAVATRHRGRLGRLLRPGVFDQLVRRARRPILVVMQPPGDAAAASPRTPSGATALKVPR